ncbi:MAG: adenosylcobinamide-GDP ribazoletransferase [Acidobacteriota bacterium]
MRSLLAAFTFLTRLPFLPARRVREEDLARSMVWFPIVGLFLGGAVAGTAHGLAGHLRPDLVGALCVALLALLTGGLHLDGLADVFDGLGGGRGDRERTLAIMRDSRTGPHGASAVTLLLIVKVLATAAVVDGRELATLAIVPVVARSLVVLLMVAFPYARTEGIALPFRGAWSAAQLAAALAMAAAAVAWAGRPAYVPAACAALLALGLGVRMARKLGGLTGDVYGAAIEIAETGFIAAACWSS